MMARPAHGTVAAPHRSLLRCGALHQIVNALCRELVLPVVGAVVPGVGAAAGVGHHDGITGVEVVEEPFRVGRADVDAAMTDVALALVIHRPWSAVYEVAAVIEADS